jgi:asparagine synthase (glutamine-hydrolysing)
LEANHYLEFNYNNFNCKIHEINQEFKTYPKISKREAIGMIHNMVQEIVVSRSIADVSLEHFGGVDSIAYYSKFSYASNNRNMLLDKEPILSIF